ncbi:ATP-binding protein [Streptantibioticus cattleyicolor]|uniref:ATPase n=1 Tax=Streptantibioticus cattleyicolor (strain ATCC 35852 / DSM 46488 / JCM 4925 / NBRC 14057 / NRRL 8057) TaxID=1003195 RepID=F8JLE7_STREN|nr:ATP-binding protein [Streptantibioticus cattleyicolor]AEW99557.1 ATPase [Streptantibioticus cattleyicolor NRRL 8057 = DSM 46488]CCB71404.1 putative AAA-family ATPase [Streptantibioticus cattleyicolor NRRL 8057 = DSM 46488]
MSVGTQAAPTGPPTDPHHLWTRLRHVEERVRTAVDERRATDPEPDDPYRGQYLTPAQVDRILAAPGTAFHPGTALGEPPPAPPGSALGRLTAAFGLPPVDVEILLVAMAPDLDPRFERLYGYLNDDLTRGRPTIGLALELCGLPGAGAGRFRFSARAPLIAHGLLEVTEAERPLLSRGLRVPDRVTAHLLGDDAADDALHGLLRSVRPGPEEASEPAQRVRAAVLGGGLVYLLDEGGGAGRLAVDALAAGGAPPLVVEPAALATEPGAAPVRALAREARLTGGGVVLGPLDRLDPRRPEGARALRELCAGLAGLPLVVHGTLAWDPSWAAQSPVSVVVPPPDARQRAERWARALSHAVGGPHRLADADGEFTEAVATYRLDEEQMERAAGLAARTAAASGRPMDAGDLRAAVRAQNAAGLDRLARRIEPAVGWDDLVLPAPVARRLRELVLRARHRDQVLGHWRMRPGGGRGRGVTALFAGGSGTGKTMSAEVVAAALGMELYVVDLATVVDKYIGETEKNLERIFTEASRVNGVLLFDEADAIFGRRSEVKDAHDRHANVESAYLLQRMESFDGIAVLTTNLRANLDEAFIRRLDVIAEFTMPDEEQRLALWDRCLGPRIPRGGDLDLAWCAGRFELSGGSIRACAVTAAYLAAEAGGPVTMRQVVSAVLQEYRKLGRLVLEGEFGPWLEAERGGA